jgi:hypothetical protein
MLLLSSQRLKSLNLRKEYGSKHKSHKERVGENFFGFGLWKTTREAPQQPENQQPQQVELVGYLYPSQGKPVVRKLVRWGPEHSRTGGWSLPGVTSDWQHGVDWLLAEYCRCRLRLDLRWCRWRTGTKGLSLAGPLRSGETSRLGLMDPVAEKDQVRAAWWQEKQGEVVDKSRCRVAAHDRSLHVGFVAVHPKIVGLLGWATEPRAEARRMETRSGSVKKLRCRGTRSGIVGLASGGRGLRRRRGCLMSNTKSSPYWSRGYVFSFHVIRVVSSFGCLHINQVERGWQTPLETLVHLLSYFFLFSL